MMRALRISLFFLVLAAIAVAVVSLAYRFSKKANTVPPSLLADTGSTTQNSSMSTGTPIDSNFQASPISLASSTIDDSSWQIYSHKSPDYSFRYPSDANISAKDSSVTVSFPKSDYFHWPLQDDSSVTITVSPICPNPVLSVPPSASSSQVFAGSQLYEHDIFSDIAAGNVYSESIYKATMGNDCYDFEFYDHGANGAGLYVDDQSLVTKYNSQHDMDMANMTDIFSGIIYSFQQGSVLQ